MCVCVCKRGKERKKIERQKTCKNVRGRQRVLEKQRKKGGDVCMCVCVRERERER